MTTKATYTAALIEALTAKGVTVDPKFLKSALAKVVRDMRNKYDGSEWALELEEAGVSNGVALYQESAASVQVTHNRKARKAFRRGW